MYRTLKSQGAFDLMQQIQDDTASSATVKLSDQIFGTASDQAKNSCKKRRPKFYLTPWLKVSILKAHHLDLKHKTWN